MNRLTVLRAEDAAVEGAALEKAVRALAKSDATLLLVSPGLDADPNKNSILQEALGALARDKLIVVPLNGAEPPLGLRDIARINWTPGDFAGARKIRAAVKATSKEKRSAANQLLEWGGALVLVLVVLGAIFSLNSEAPWGGLGPSSNGIQGVLGAEPSRPARWTGIMARAEDLEARGLQPRLLQEGQAPGGRLLELGPIELPAGEHWIIGRCGGELCSLTVRNGAEESRSYSSPNPSVAVINDSDRPIPVFATLDTAFCGDSAQCSYSFRVFSRAYEGSPAEIVRAGQIDALRVQMAALRARVDMSEATPSSTNRVTGDANPWLMRAAIVGGVLLALLALAAALMRRRKQRRRHNQDAPVAGPLVFASYSRSDRVSVDRLLRELEAQGVDVWVDREQLKGGVTWSEEIVQAIRNSSGLILFGSTRAFESDHVLREVCLADTYKKPLYPLLIESTGIPDSFIYYLSTRQVIDMNADADWRAKISQALSPHQNA